MNFLKQFNHLLFTISLLFLLFIICIKSGKSSGGFLKNLKSWTTKKSPNIKQKQPKFIIKDSEICDLKS